MRDPGFTIETATTERALRSNSPALICLFLWVFAVLGGCDSGGKSETAVSAWPTAADLGPGDILAADFTTAEPHPYIVNAVQVADGIHCVVYVEQGRTVSDSLIAKIRDEFDLKIYPGVTGTFGDEPKPGIDNDSKVHILLLDIRDGYNWASQPTYIAGYFDPANESTAGEYPYSNQKELIYMDISPADPASPHFLITLAHEFQHMVHWEQKDNHYGVTDETWLDEAMSEIAPVYCGYGPSYSRVGTFKTTPSDSLTGWNGAITDYAVAYVWAHYMKDRFSNAVPNIFQSILQNDQTGINAVNAALDLTAPPATFASVFKDWTIANYSGNIITWPGHPEWSYTSLNTRASPDLFPVAARNPASPLPNLEMWSAGYYSYTPLSQATGTLTWTASGDTETAALADPTPAINYSLVSGQAYTFTTAAYLIRSNAGDGSLPTGAYVTRSSAENGIAEAAAPFKEKASAHGAKTPRVLLDQASADYRLRPPKAGEGPEPVCVHSYFAEKGKNLRARPPKTRF